MGEDIDVPRVVWCQQLSLHASWLNQVEIYFSVVLPALIPIGLLAGLSAVVTLLLIVSVASNKVQGIAMVRALGMLIAGLPCLPWFIHSSWNLAFGVLPPYWAAKAFWVASEHGTWWPYLLGGVVYNLAVAWPQFRRFVARNT